MNLKPRFLLLTALLFVLAAAAAWLAARELAEGIVEQWAVRYAEKQMLYDKERTLQPILREIALARQFASSPLLRKWAQHPEDASLAEAALEEMERYRELFSDRCYFVALKANGHYYYNDADNRFAGRQLRYTLDPAKPADRWFYDIVGQQRALHLNVNPDVELGVTKLWIDVLMRDGKRVLGVVGTGFELQRFVRELLMQTQPGMSSLFVDHEGAIQAYRDLSLVDFASITKQASEHSSVDRLFDRAEDSRSVRELMRELETANSASVGSRFVELKGRPYLAGVVWLSEIGWFEITLFDLDTLLPLDRFTGLLVVYGASLLMALLVFNAVLGRLVLRPLAALDRAMDEVQRERSAPHHLPDNAPGEIGRLISHFRNMVQALFDSRSELEHKVTERTEALERLTQTDALTGLLNRRGMAERLAAEVARSNRNGRRFGILWLDVDHFKEVNDCYGHAQGDAALTCIAGLIRSVVRPYDAAARWGGDEFLVLVQDCDRTLLDDLGERLRSAVEHCQGGDHCAQDMLLTVSVGGHLAAATEGLDPALQRADQALYAAKADGRNVYRCLDGEGNTHAQSG